MIDDFFIFIEIDLLVWLKFEQKRPLIYKVLHKIKMIKKPTFVSVLMS